MKCGVPRGKSGTDIRNAVNNHEGEQKAMEGYYSMRIK
jgi:hypothetical protein